MASVETTRNNRQAEKSVPASGVGKAMAGGRKVGETLTQGWEERLREALESDGRGVSEAQAPTFEELRPYGHQETAGFPVYKDLENRLLNAVDQPDPVVAHVMATCAAYAYSDPKTLSMIMARMGLEDNHIQMIRSSVDAMLICSTAFLIQSRSGRVAILCYRGTEPLNFINWLSDLDVDPERIGYRIGDPCATVHAGVYRNVRATRYEVMNLLRRATDRHSDHAQVPGDALHSRPARFDGNLEALYITGHSLGGGMAALMGVMLRHERKYEDLAARLRAVYTFGQPMIGDPNFAEACQSEPFLRDKVIRYTYDSDVVPHLPSTASGPFRHFGREFHYRIPHLRNGIVGTLAPAARTSITRKGRWEARRRPAPQMPGLLGIPLSAMAFVARKFHATRALPVMYSIDDHLPQHYISALTPPGVQNEFGD
ncbi:lipase family protein [Sphaerisporangium sp. TRM90804]|uniref:lipase family protein n=1 Tax=Sphaerisporangium sp. TRM90804 TaxID=3031113 RepID=UPI00244A8A8A|nr:lipase family protein [Sphaerisporangium sp. TRM90804]MDH2426327.1 lipase family protein [Sphaerisporangium sp. TRM90804]